MERLVNSKGLAKRYQVSVETIRSWYRRGWIPALKAGRRPLLFDPREVDAVLRKPSLVPRLIHPGFTRDPATNRTTMKSHSCLGTRLGFLS